MSHFLFTGIVRSPSLDTPNRDAVRLWTALGPCSAVWQQPDTRCAPTPAWIPPTVTPCGYGRLWGPGSAVWQQPDTRCAPTPAWIPPTVTPCGYGRLWGPGSAVWQQPDTRCAPTPAWIPPTMRRAAVDGSGAQALPCGSGQTPGVRRGHWACAHAEVIAFGRRRWPCAHAEFITFDGTGGIGRVSMHNLLLLAELKVLGMYPCRIYYFWRN